MAITRKRQNPRTAKTATQKKQIRPHAVSVNTEIHHKQNTTSARRDFFKSLVSVHIQ
jgi:hypothetical protein